MSRGALIVVIATGILASSFFLWQERSLEKGEWGFPLDDAWIHCRFAQNLAAGQAFSFNPGEPTPGSTSPLWVVLLAGLSRATGRFVFSSVSLGILFYLFSVYLSYRLALLVIPDHVVATVVGFLVALSGRFLWGSLSGMEVSLFTFLALAGLYFHVRGARRIKDGVLSALLLGLATNARPEGYLLFALCFLDSILSAFSPRPGGDSGKVRLRFALKVLSLQLLIFLALVLPYVLFSLKTAGHIFPNTYYAKRGITGPNLDRGVVYLQQAIGTWFFHDNPLLLVSSVPGLAYLIRRWRPRETEGVNLRVLTLWIPIFLIVSAIQTPYLQNMARYLIPLIPVLVLVGVLGMVQIAEWLKGMEPGLRIQGRQVSVIMILLVVLALLYNIYWATQWSQVYALNVDNINKEQVALGKWARSNLPPGSLIGTHDIGAIGFFSNLRVLDTCGLISPDILPYLRKYAYTPGGYREGIYRFLFERRVQYLVIFPDQFPEIVNSSRLKPLYAVEYPNNTGGGDVMAVYRVNYSK